MVAGLLGAGLILGHTTGCSVATGTAAGKECAPASGPTPADIAQDMTHGMQQPRDRVKVSRAFNSHWRDGKGELSGYEITTSRYGKLHRGRTVLIYVTEPVDTRVWIKAERGPVPPEHRAEVLKLNHVLKFSTGIYPYSVLTSVFSPLDGQGRERFAPGKISLSAQEWCGHFFQQIHPKGDRYHSQMHSYFGGEGDAGETVTTAEGTLYEDALWIQLRELDGQFNGGKDWSGQLVPSLWSRRKAHVKLRPVPATITRSRATLDGTPVTRFVVKRSGLTRTFDVEQAYPHRILAWNASDGEKARLLKTTRLAYWKLHNPGDESFLEQLGF
jgi:hypothetical protein